MRWMPKLEGFGRSFACTTPAAPLCQWRAAGSSCNTTAAQAEWSCSTAAGRAVSSFPVPLLRGEILSRVESEYSGNGVYVATLLPPAVPGCCTSQTGEK